MASKAKCDFNHSFQQIIRAHPTRIKPRRRQRQRNLNGKRKKEQLGISLVTREVSLFSLLFFVVVFLTAGCWLWDLGD